MIQQVYGRNVARFQSFKAVEIPGPPGMESWLACWRVYRTILLMLGRLDPTTGVRKPIVTVAALEEYVDRIQELVTEFPECWHLIMQAEDRMRAEQFERILSHFPVQSPSLCFWNNWD